MSSAEDMSLLTTSPTASPSEPHLEEIPPELVEADAPPLNPAPAIKTNMVAHEVRLQVTGAPPDKSASERALFTEETTSVLVGENGGVIRLSAAVTPGQLLFLRNLESKREVVAQVKRKRAYRPTNCYVELEFAETVPRFWNMEFSAASALLPKDAQETEAAALVISAESTADEPGEPPVAPTVEAVQALKRQVDALREQPKLIPTSAADQQLAATVPDAAAEASPPLTIGDAPSADKSSNSGSEETPVVAFTPKSLPIEDEPVPAQLTVAEEALLPRPSLDFAMSLPKSKRSLRARGSFTPNFRGGILRLALLATALVVTAVGAAWYKHWIPWNSAAKKTSVRAPATAANAKTSLPSGSQEAPRENSEFGNTRVASDAPVTSPGVLSKSAVSPNTVPPEQVEAAAPPGQHSELSGSVAQPAARKTSSSTALSGKHSTDRPAVKTVSNSVATPAAESAIVPPKLLKSVRAVASLDALRDFETGNVVIDAVVGTSGEVNFISVLSGPPSLRDSAVESLKQFQYEPAKRDGQPVPAHVTITIHFRFEP